MIKSVRDRAAYHTVPFPTLKFHGTIKLHGTNAGIILNDSKGSDTQTHEEWVNSREMWAQSREQIITPENDNAGFAKFVVTVEPEIKALFSGIRLSAAMLHFPFENLHMGIYGEWCGQGILKGCAVHQLPKMFVIFGIKLIDGASEDQFGVWLQPADVTLVFNAVGQEMLAKKQIYCIYNFPSFDIDIDFVNPEYAQNKLVEITNQVEAECPVSKAFGVSGIGEGVVWRCVSEAKPIQTDDLIFKVKGPKHSDTKTKQTASVDVEKVRTIKEFAEKVVTDHRLEKMIELLKQSGAAIDVKSTGAFLKLVGSDVIKEESDMIDASGLTRQEVMPNVNLLARQWFMKLLDKDAGL